MDAVCIGVFTIEYVLRLFASPATIGLGAFLSSVPNWIDLVAILPFYVDLVVMAAAPNADAGGGKVLGVLRIVRLTRVLRVLKFSKSLSGIVVLVRTVAQSGSAMMLIASFTIINCVLWASLMMSTPELGKWDGDLQVYVRIDGTASLFSRMTDVWWWCLQTLTSVGYGSPCSIEELGKVTSMITALVGTVVLALPIAVVGLTFDDEWSKQAKTNQFQALSCVYEYNQQTLNSTRHVQAPQPSYLSRLGALLSGTAKDANRIAPHTPMPPESEPDANASLAAALSPDEPRMLQQARSRRGTCFESASHTENQAYNLQADMATLLESHFASIRYASQQILDEQREKLCRSLHTDLKAALRDHVLTTAGVDAFKQAMQRAILKSRTEAGEASAPSDSSMYKVKEGLKRTGIARVVAMAHAAANKSDVDDKPSDACDKIMETVDAAVAQSHSQVSEQASNAIEEM